MQEELVVDYTTGLHAVEVEVVGGVVDGEEDAAALREGVVGDPILYEVVALEEVHGDDLVLAQLVAVEGLAVCLGFRALGVVLLCPHRRLAWAINLVLLILDGNLAAAVEQPGVLALLDLQPEVCLRSYLEEEGLRDLGLDDLVFVFAELDRIS